MVAYAEQLTVTITGGHDCGQGVVGPTTPTCTCTICPRCQGRYWIMREAPAEPSIFGGLELDLKEILRRSRAMMRAFLGDLFPLRPPLRRPARAPEKNMTLAPRRDCLRRSARGTINRRRRRR